MCIRDSLNIGSAILGGFCIDELIVFEAFRTVRINHGFEHGNYSVSYTHLDVYKRQLLIMGRHYNQVLALLFSLPYCVPGFHIKSLCFVAVSYTQLDVYKRQDRRIS